MSNELKKIKDQLEILLVAINDYLSTNLNDEIIINKNEFNKIRHLGKINSFINVFDFNNGILFTLREGASYSYEDFHLQKLFSGELDRIILKKRKDIWQKDDWSINYDLESPQETKLRDLYSK